MDHQWQVTDVVILTCAPDRTYVFSPKRYAENKHRTYLVKVKATIVSRRYTTCLFTPVRKTQKDTQCMYKYNSGARLCNHC